MKCANSSSNCYQLKYDTHTSILALKIETIFQTLSCFKTKLIYLSLLFSLFHLLQLQTALTLAVAEQKFEFEHRDLHWGNILIAPTTEKFVEYRINGKIIKFLTHGVKVTIIDYSLSRMVFDGAILYDNLARDEELFEASGDYQFDIYRLMRQRVE